MKNKLGKRVLTMALAMVLTFASCVTAFAQMGTSGDYFIELADYYNVWKGTANDAGQIRAYVEMTTANDATNLNANIKEVLAKDYFVKGSTLTTRSEYGAVSKDNLATLVTKEGRLSVSTYQSALSAWVDVQKVTNADADFDGTIVYESTEAVTNKLKAAGYAGKSLQFHTKGSGRLPGVANFTICDFETTYVEAGDYVNGDAYLYYYDAVADAFVLVDDAKYYSSNSSYGYKYLEFWSKNAKAVNKGAYVFTTDKIADTAVKKVDVSLTTDSKFSTKDYVGKAMEVSTKAGKWYFPSVTAAVDFDPSFEVGKKLEKVSKKLATVTLPATLKYVTLDFAFSGDLPGTANVTVDLSSAGFTEGQTVYLYYYNPEKNIFELTSEAAYKNGSATFTMTHCSEYIVTNEKLPTALTSITVKTGDATNAIPFVIALICGCAAIGVVVVRRRTVK